ncbi:MAG: peptidoglycan-binding protein [Actinobacteria bacterium]|nr:MAG: peptidoglycan-binding protein [Actinomycetota bacterium]
MLAQRRTGRRRAAGVLLAAAALGAALGAPAVAQAKLGDRVLRFGQRGADVRALQGYLDAAGYQLPETGRFDAATRVRVRWFQADAGMSPTGVVTLQVARAIIRTATAPAGSAGGTAYQRPATQPPGPTPAGVTTVAGSRARVLSNGLAAAPANAPAEVKAIIASGNQIAKLPYKWGGGHSSWTDTGYDCSGSTTYALRTTFRRGPAPTFGYDNWGLAGPGQWVTVYASSYHVFMVVAGLRFDTSGLHENGSRWTSSSRSMSGFRARHPARF